MTQKEKIAQINYYLKSIARGDYSCIEKLYSLISPTIRYIALKYLGNQSEADDLVQDFWADIQKIALRFVFSFNGRAYLCKVMKNRAINRYRKFKNERAHIVYVDYSKISTESDAETDVLLRRTMIDSALNELSVIERIVIQETYFESKTVREIARDLKISTASVVRYKEKSINKMKKYLETCNK